ncbi:MAG: T9SS type A sorting domain-containing protein, partial [Bacteroidales bacterium]|nr:T9SS type A sorting domain-containing protein [Bacteroidales bacterium]
NPTTMVVNIMPVPAAPGPVTGTPELCAGSENVIYSVLPVPDATNYTWNLPYGATIVEGEYTNIIEVDFSPEAVSGMITVYASNNCGEGPASPNYSLTVNPIPPTPVVTVMDGYLLHSSAPEGNQWYFNGDAIPGATGQDFQAEAEGIYMTIVTLNGCSSFESNEVEVIFTGLDDMAGVRFNIYPVPNNGSFTVSFDIQKEETFFISVFNNIGVKVYEMKDFHANDAALLTIDLDNPSNGFYTVVFTGSDQTVIRKILVSR